MENRKELIEKELKIEQEKIQKEIDKLKKEKENYGFDHEYMNKQIKKSKIITTTNFALASLTSFLDAPWSVMGTMSYMLLEHLVENLIQMITGKNFLRIGKNKHLNFFTFSHEIVSNYKETLNINYEIEKLNIKNKIVEKAIKINKEDYRIINYNSKNENNKNIDLIAAKKAIENNNFFQGDERFYSKKLLNKNIVLKLFGATTLCMINMPNFSISTALLFGVSSFVMSQASCILIDLNKLDLPKICTEENDNFLNRKLSDKKFINNDKNNQINIDVLTNNIIEEEAYKMVNDYNHNVESIIRQRKIDEYYKKKEEIVRILKNNNERKIEKVKKKVLQKIY